MSELKQIIGELFQFRGRVAASLIFAILTILTGIGLIAASGYLITWSAYRPPILDMILVLVAVRFFGISRAAFRYVERLISHDLTFRILKNLRVRFYRAVEPVLPAKAIRYWSTDLLSRFSEDVDQLQEFYLKVVAPAITAIFFILLTSFVVGWYSTGLGVVIFLLMSTNAFVLPLLIRKISGKPAPKTSGGGSILNQYMNDHIRGATDLIFSSQYAEWIKTGERTINKIASTQQKRAKAFALQSGLFTLFSNASIPISFLLLFPMAQEQSISVLMMVAIILGLFSVFEALEPMGNALQHMAESKEAAERIQEITTPEEKTDPEKNSTGFYPHDASLYLINVEFGYTSNLVLKGVDMEIRPGEYVLLKGPSGCGKSTIVHLLSKWFEPSGGRILFGGQSINQIEGAVVRKKISVVSQHTRLFNTTLRNNLKIAKPDATDKELMDILEKVQFIPAFKKLPHGLSTQVGELGLRLSGGERQRVAVARALLKNAPFWILDEPLANLDKTISEKILDTLVTLSEDKTVLHITHQNSGLKYADRLYEMAGGKMFLREDVGVL